MTPTMETTDTAMTTDLGGDREGSAARLVGVAAMQ
jgi:hypothetical protein